VGQAGAELPTSTCGSAAAAAALVGEALGLRWKIVSCGRWTNDSRSAINFLRVSEALEKVRILGVDDLGGSETGCWVLPRDEEHLQLTAVQKSSTTCWRSGCPRRSRSRWLESSSAARARRHRGGDRHCRGVLKTALTPAHCRWKRLLIWLGLGDVCEIHFWSSFLFAPGQSGMAGCDAFAPPEWPSSSWSIGATHFFSSSSPRRARSGRTPAVPRLRASIAVRRSPPDLRVHGRGATQAK
jgi:hypothetical protein